MLPKLLPIFLMLLGSTAAQVQAQNNNGALPQNTVPSPPVTTAPPIKMGLWEATITTSTSRVYKTRSCMTQQSYQEMLTHMPPGCTVSNLTNSGTRITGDVSCTASNGNTSTGHVDVRIPDSGTAHSTVTMSASMQGRTMTLTATTDSHFVSSDCGDLSPGTTEDIR